MMGKNRVAKILSAGLIASVTACLEPYYASDIAVSPDILVMDGFLNATDGSATVRLTHTAKSITDAVFPIETQAIVTVKSENGDVIKLVEQDSGRYIAEGLVIDRSLKYQLQITTSGGEEYGSDFISITETPLIDSLSWRQWRDGLQISANTHDVTGKSRYYRWSYVETWEYHAPYLSGYTAVNNTATYREPEEFMFACYKSSVSRNILVSSTERLAEDVVSEFPLVFIPRESSRISVLYHVDVQQRVIEKKEYEFWSDLERVTENLGGLFDSQPYGIVGNIHSLGNPDRPVMGYFSGGQVTHKEMFIPYEGLTEDLQKRPFHGCTLDTVCVALTPERRCRFNLADLPTNTYLIGSLSENGIIWGYTASGQSCADCRLQGGVLTKPDFWP